MLVRLDSKRPHLLLPAAVGAPVQHQNTVRVSDRNLQGRRRPDGRDAGLDRPAGAVEEHHPGLGGQFPGVRYPQTGDDGDRQSVPPERRVDPTRNIVPDTPDADHDLLVGAGEVRGVRELLMDLLLRPGEEGAEPSLADGNKVIHLLLVELTKVFDPVAGDVDPDLGHRPDGVGVQGPRFGAGGEGLIAVAIACVHIPFRHLRPGGIMGADKEDFLPHAITPARAP